MPTLAATEKSLEPSRLSADVSLSASVVCNVEGLAQLSEEWGQLFRSLGCSNVFLSFEWMSQWWKHSGRGEKLFVIAVRDTSERLVALAPLYISRKGGPLQLRRLGFLGDCIVGSDYLDVLADSNCAREALSCLVSCIRAHRDQWDYIDLADTKADSHASTLLRDFLAKDGLTPVTAGSSTCPCAFLPTTPEAYLASLGPKLRKHLKYYLNSLQRLGAVEFVTVTQRAEIGTAFEDLMRLHCARFTEREGNSKFADVRVGEFHRGAVAELASAGLARIHVLKLEGKAIAAVYVLSTGGKAFFYQSGMDPLYSRFSTGSLLIRFAIEDAIRNRCEEFDFLRGDEGYKKQWTNGARQMRSLRFFDGRAKSRIARGLHTARRYASSCKATLLRAEIPLKIRTAAQRLSSGKTKSSKQGVPTV